MRTGSTILTRARRARSTLADANAARPSEVFALFAHLVAQAWRGLRRKTGEAVHLIDSTGCA